MLRFVAAKPPQTIIFVPVHTAVWLPRAVGAPVVEVAVQESPAGSYRPPVFAFVPSKPPQTIIFVPVHTAVWSQRPVGATVVEVGVQELPAGSY